MTHDLLKNSAGLFECRVCLQTWKTKPRTTCPGIKIYRLAYDLPFVTKRQLGHLGYQTSTDALPPAVGGYYSHTAKGYLPLYDPSQAVRTAKTRQRVRACIRELLWPVSCVPYLTMLPQVRQELAASPAEYQKYWQKVQDIANIAAQTHSLTQFELEHIAGDCITLRIPPTLIHRFYLRLNAHHEEQSSLANRLVRAYRNYLSQSRMEGDPQAIDMEGSQPDDT